MLELCSSLIHCFPKEEAPSPVGAVTQRQAVIELKVPTCMKCPPIETLWLSATPHQVLDHHGAQREAHQLELLAEVLEKSEYSKSAREMYAVFDILC